MDKKSIEKKEPTGLHIIGKIYTNSDELCNDGDFVKKKISKIIKKYGLKELGSYYYKFPKSGYTGIICLAESHLTYHSWPEYNCITVDVFLCNYLRDNSTVCKKVFNEVAKIFKPETVIKNEVER